MTAPLPAWVGSYVGARYEKEGRGPAYDCIGLYLRVVEREAGIALPEYDGPPWEKASSIKELGAAAASFAERFVEIRAGTETAFDAVLLKMRRQPIHIGVVIAKGLMLHIEESCDAVVESYRSKAWENRIVGFFRPALRAAA